MDTMFNGTQNNGTKNQKRAFTLVELLVLIAILALLAAVLLPALGATPFGKGGFAAKVANCANNYRQWAVAANLYANDNAGNLPSFPQPATGFNPTDELPSVGTPGLKAPFSTICILPSMPPISNAAPVARGSKAAE